MPQLRRVPHARQALPPMRRLIPALALSTAGWLVIGGLLSNSAAAPLGTIRGRVVNGATDDPQAGVRVTLSGGRAGGRRIVRHTRTDSAGRYRFERLRTGDDYFYAIDARFQGGVFAGRALTLPADTEVAPVIDTTLRVWPTTTDPAAILFRRNDLFVVPSEDGLAVIESVRVLNSSERAYIGRRAADGASATLGFALSSDASRRGLRIVDSTIDIPELVSTDFGFGITIAIPPGETQVSFAYTANSAAGTSELSRPSLYPIIDLSIFAGEGVRIESNRLVPGDEVTVGDRLYREYSSGEALDAGDPLQAVAITEARADLTLVLGTAGTLGLVGLIGVAAFLAARRRSGAPKLPKHRVDLVTAIATLDLRHEAGQLGDEEWDAQRALLKAELDRRTASAS